MSWTVWFPARMESFHSPIQSKMELQSLSRLEIQVFEPRSKHGVLNDYGSDVSITYVLTVYPTDAFMKHSTRPLL